MVRLPILPAALCALASCAEAALSLNLTTLTGRQNVSVLECWQISTPFTTSTEAGVVGSQSLDFGNVTNATYSILPANFNGGLHNAPSRQYVWFISGLAHISCPNHTDQSAYVYGGKYGLIYADDTHDISGWGHLTVYPGNDQTVALELPIQGGQRPNHTVLHSGACTADEMAGV